MARKLSRAALAVITVMLAFAAAPSASAITVGSIVTVLGPAYAQGPGMSSFTVSPQEAGDVLVGFIEIDPQPATVSSLSSNGVTWSRIYQFIGDDGKDYELWKGIVQASGTDTVTINFAGTVGTSDVKTGFQEFAAINYGAATVWTVDASGTGGSATPTTTIQYPALTASGPGELYWGYGQTAGAGSEGSTPGFTYSVTPAHGVVTWNTNASGTIAPTATTSLATTHTIAVLLKASLQFPLTAGTGYEDLNPDGFLSLVMDARDDATYNPAVNGDPVQAWTNLGRLNQRFTVVPVSGDTFEIKSAQSGKCLDATWDSRLHQSPYVNGDKLQLWTCRGSVNQLWRPYATSGPGDHSIASVASGKVIDDTLAGGDGTRLQLWSYNGLKQQSWAFAGFGGAGGG